MTGKLLALSYFALFAVAFASSHGCGDQVPWFMALPLFAIVLLSSMILVEWFSEGLRWLAQRWAQP